MATPSIIIVGGGTMGIACAWSLARRGASVTVLEEHHHVHELGSHGGFTRALRHAYHEGSSYVPLVQEADRAWIELGQRLEEELLVRCGLLEFGPPDDAEYAAALEMCTVHELDHDLLDAREAMKRWPFWLPDDWGACFTPSGGYLRVKPCLDALRAEAEAAGAVFREHSRVATVTPETDAVVVTLASGETLRADRVVVSAGVGVPDLLEGLPRLTRMRRALIWTSPAEEDRPALERLPVWGAFVPEGFFYGFPWKREGIDGLKMACHRPRPPRGADDPVDPATLDRSLLDEDLAPLHGFIEGYFPAATKKIRKHQICMYTTTDNWDFLVDRWPKSDRVVIAGGFSGHGFKFAPAIGRLVAQMVLDDADAPAEFALGAHGA